MKEYCETGLIVCRPPDPFEYRQLLSDVTITYFNYQEGKRGAFLCVSPPATVDVHFHLAVLDEAMGEYERDYANGRSHLFLHPGPRMLWQHWQQSVLNMWEVVARDDHVLPFTLDGYGFDFEIDADGIGRVGFGNFTEFSE